MGLQQKILIMCWKNKKPIVLTRKWWVITLMLVHLNALSFSTLKQRTSSFSCGDVCVFSYSLAELQNCKPPPKNKRLFRQMNNKTCIMFCHLFFSFWSWIHTKHWLISRWFTCGEGHSNRFPLLMELNQAMKLLQFSLQSQILIKNHYMKNRLKNKL